VHVAEFNLMFWNTAVHCTQVKPQCSCGCWRCTLVYLHLPILTRSRPRCFLKRCHNAGKVRAMRFEELFALADWACRWQSRSLDPRCQDASGCVEDALRES
jgi:hypothetical protein